MCNFFTIIVRICYLQCHCYIHIYIYACTQIYIYLYVYICVRIPKLEVCLCEYSCRFQRSGEPNTFLECLHMLLMAALDIYLVGKLMVDMTGRH